MLSQKYTVTKTEDWADLVRAVLEGDQERALELLADAPIGGDYFVIRDQDVFGAQGLFAYAGQIRTAVEFTDTVGLSVMTSDVRQRLMDLADDIVDTGVAWQERQRTGLVSSVTAKLPD